MVLAGEHYIICIILHVLEHLADLPPDEHCQVAGLARLYRPHPSVCAGVCCWPDRQSDQAMNQSSHAQTMIQPTTSSLQAVIC